MDTKSYSGNYSEKRKMSVYTALEPTLKNILDSVKPLQEDWEARFKIIAELQDVVKSIESLRGASVEPFGSFVSNLFSQSGDVDISILLPNGSHISCAGKRRRQNLLDEVQRFLRMQDGWRRLQFIPNARVPILKFESRRTGILCDVSIDNFQGLMKSKFLLWIGEIDRRFRDMVLLVKEWAKAHNINNPKAGSFNSYSLSLLVIFHFQTCVPPILPPLKDIYPRNAVDDLQGVRADAERYIAEVCAANITKYRFDKGRAVNRCSLAELFVSFLAKFSDISWKASELGICPFTGKWEEVRGNMRWLPRTCAIFIEDPFEQPENTARAVSAINLIRINEAINRTYTSLVSANHDRSSLLSALVRPQVSRHFAGTTISKPNLSYSNHIAATHPQMSRSVVLPPQAQNQVYNVRQQRYPGNKATRQVQGSQQGNPTKQVQGSQQGNPTKLVQGSHQGNATKLVQGSPGAKLVHGSQQGNSTKLVQGSPEAKLVQGSHQGNSTKLVQGSPQAELLQGSHQGNSTKQVQGSQQSNLTKQVQGSHQGNPTKLVQGSHQGNATKLVQGSHQGNATKLVQGSPQAKLVQGSHQGNSTKQVQGSQQSNPTKQVQGSQQGNPTKLVQGSHQGNATKLVQGSHQGNSTKQVQGSQQSNPTKQVQGSQQGNPTKLVQGSHQGNETKLVQKSPRAKLVHGSQQGNSTKLVQGSPQAKLVQGSHQGNATKLVQGSPQAKLLQGSRQGNSTRQSPAKQSQAQIQAIWRQKDLAP